MGRTENQKLKLLLIRDYLLENTDENHSVSTVDIINMLDRNGITAERKSVYADMEALKIRGMDIDHARGRMGGFRLLTRRFQLPELKLLVDAVQASRFITLKKSAELISKLESMASVYDRKELQRNVFIANRIKTDNEAIYYNTDVIYNAINNDKQIAFKYFNFGVDKKKHYHNNGKTAIVSPYGLQYDNEKYYLIAFDNEAKIIKHYRVDKMDNVEIVNEIRKGKSKFRKFDIAAYSAAAIKMFSGEITKVTFNFKDEFAGAIIDKFGKTGKFFPAENGRHTVSIPVVLSPTLYSWVFEFGDGIQITYPEKAVEAYKQQLAKAIDAMNKI